MEDASSAGGGTGGQGVGGAMSDQALAASLAAEDADASDVNRQRLIGDGGGGGGGSVRPPSPNDELASDSDRFRPPLEIMHKGDFFR